MSFALSIAKLVRRLFNRQLCFLVTRYLSSANNFSSHCIFPIRREHIQNHGTRDEIVPFAQGRAICDVLPSSEFVALPNCGHNDTFNGASYRLIVDALEAFLAGHTWGGGRKLGT